MKNRSAHKTHKADPAADTSASRRLDTKGAADYLCASVPWLKRERQLGRGPAYSLIGRKPVYDTRDLDEYLEQNRREPEAACHG